MFNFGNPSQGMLSPDDQSALYQNMLMRFGLGMLSQSGPSAEKKSFGQMFANSSMDAINSGQQFSSQAVQNKFHKSKLDELERKKQADIKLQGLLGSAPVHTGATPNDDEGNVMGTPGTGLLGGEITPKQFYAGVAGLGGDYTKYGMSAMQNEDVLQKGRGDYFQFLPTAGGYMVGDTRRGTITAPGGARVMPAQFDTSLQEDLSRGKERGRGTGEIDVNTNVKKPQQAKDLLSLLNETDGLIDKSTGSYAGRGVDYLARGVGLSTEGDKANAQLKILQAGLMTNMPRMEGPQSDRDVQLYQEAAGQIGDATVPNDIKKAAVKTIRTINERYAARGKSYTPSSSIDDLLKKY